MHRLFYMVKDQQARARRDLDLSEVQDVALVAAEQLPVGIGKSRRMDGVVGRVREEPAIGRRELSRDPRGRPSLVSPPMFLAANSTFWPSSRTPISTRSTIAVTFRSSRTAGSPGARSIGYGLRLLRL